MRMIDVSTDLSTVQYQAQKIKTKNPKQTEKEHHSLIAVFFQLPDLIKWYTAKHDTALHYDMHYNYAGYIDALDILISIAYPDIIQ